MCDTLNGNSLRNRCRWTDYKPKFLLFSLPTFSFMHFDLMSYSHLEHSSIRIIFIPNQPVNSLKLISLHRTICQIFKTNYSDWIKFKRINTDWKYTHTFKMMQVCSEIHLNRQECVPLSVHSTSIYVCSTSEMESKEIEFCMHTRHFSVIPLLRYANAYQMQTKNNWQKNERNLLKSVKSITLWNWFKFPLFRAVGREFDFHFSRKLTWSIQVWTFAV